MLTIQTAPAAWPIDVAEARAQVRKDLPNEDAQLRRALAACTAWAETETRCSFVSRRYLLTLDAFPACGIELERGPVLAVQSVDYLDMGGNWVTLDPALYTSDAGRPPKISPVFGVPWQPTLPQAGAVRVVFDAGFAAPLTIDATANTIRVRGIWPALQVGAAVRLSNSGGALPAPLELMTEYYVQQVVSPGVYKLAATEGGSAIDLQGAGTGTQYIGEVPDNVISWMLLRIGSLFENRESEVVLERGTLTPLPYVDRLLDGTSVVTY